MGQDFKVQDDSGDTFYLNVCGGVGTICPEDAGDPPVTEGMAVQTIPGDGGGCYVLAQYSGGDCLWTSNPGGHEGIQLVLDNGSDNLCADGSPRDLTVDFLCPAEGSTGPLIPETWTAVNLPGSCMFTYTFETCAACEGGCTAPPYPPPTPPAPSPGSSGGSTNDDMYPHALVATLAVFCGIFGAIVFGGVGYLMWQRHKTLRSSIDQPYVEI